jgi:acyl-homoserine-lactone acylase
VSATLVAILVGSGLAVPAAEAAAPSGYRAVIRRTSFGVPHILADSLGNVAFGQAWAYAEDRFCDLADQVVKVRSERSRWFGPGPDGINLASDFGYRALGVVERAQQQHQRLNAEERQIVDGYVRGFNAFLAATGRNRLPGFCAGQPWVAPITAVDLLAYQRDIALLASGNSLLAPIALAQPPGAAGLPVGARAVADGVAKLAAQRSGDAALSSNAWALGRDKSVTGRGALLANPHFPWQGELRFWESHLTVPGQLNVYGASLGGLPGVQIGFTDRIAWSHTVAAGSRLTFYLVPLVPGSPTTYIVDGRQERMVAKQVTIMVNNGGNALQPVTQTMWSTRYGPVLDLSSVDPSLGWNSATALTYRDANIDNDRLIRQWFGIARATSVTGVRDAIARDHGIPWVNTIATDNQGNAFYTDSSPTPNLSASALAEWASNPLGLLDGSNSANAWVVRPGARSPGLIPYAQQPQLTRRDYVFNANDSHWVANERQFLTGFSPLQGPEGTPLTLRTRQNVRLINGVVPGTVDGQGRFDLPGLGTAILSGNTLLADELAGYLVTTCRARGTQPVNVDGVAVDISPGCNAIANWNRQMELSSSGAVLWRETIGAVVAANPDALTSAGPLFGVPFNPADPLRTPRGTPADPVPLLTGLARGMLRMRSLGLPLNVPLGAVQYTVKGTERIPVPGSTENLGIANMAIYSPAPGTTMEPVMDGGTFVEGSDLTDKGYVVNYGTSILLTVMYTSTGLNARGLLTFSESGDPASPHFADQTRLYSRKQLRECRFTEASIASDPALAVKVVAGP